MTNFVLDTTGLLEPQIQHSIKLLNSIYLNGIACDLSETGVGKTYCASWIAKQLNVPTVVICPKKVTPVWNKILGKFGVKPSVLINYEKLMRGNTPYVKYREPMIDPNTGQPKKESRCHLVQIKLPVGCLVILDEAHKCKGAFSLNAGLMISLKRQGYKVLTLSATQATNPLEMRAFGFAVNFHNLYKWKEWCLDNGAQEIVRYGALRYDNENKQAQEKMALCHTNLFDIQQIASRLTRQQMGSLFPDNHIVAEAFDLGSNSPKIQAVYDEMEEEIDKLNECCENYSGHVFAEIIKARRKAELLKIPLFQEMIEDLYDEGKSVVSFLNFTESINALSLRLKQNDKLKEKIGFVYGEQKFKERWQDIEDFQSDKKRVLICNLKSGGDSLSFHDLNGKYPRSTLLSPSFSAVDMLQALGRVHRQGGLTPCFQQFIYAANCIEEIACNRVQSRLNNLSCLVDGDLQAGFKIFN